MLHFPLASPRRLWQQSWAAILSIYCHFVRPTSALIVGPTLWRIAITKPFHACILWPVLFREPRQHWKSSQFLNNHSPAEKSPRACIHKRSQPTVQQQSDRAQVSDTEVYISTGSCQCDRATEGDRVITFWPNEQTGAYYTASTSWEHWPLETTTRRNVCSMHCILLTAVELCEINRCWFIGVNRVLCESCGRYLWVERWNKKGLLLVRTDY